RPEQLTRMLATWRSAFWSLPEVNVRCLVCAFVSLEVIDLLLTHEGSEDTTREGADLVVVLSCRVIVVLTVHVDTILSTLQLRLEILIPGCTLEFRIVFHVHQDAIQP